MYCRICGSVMGPATEMIAGMRNPKTDLRTEYRKLIAHVLIGMGRPRADDQVKLILLGNGSVGKTSIINRFIEDGFRKVYKQVN